MSANHLSPYFPTDEGDAQLFQNTLSPRPNILSELNNAAPNSSPSHCTIVVDLPQRPLQGHLPNHNLLMNTKTTSDLERNLPSSKIQFYAAESRAHPNDTLTPSVLERSLDALANAALSTVLSNTPDADVSLQVVAGHTHTQENLPTPVTAAANSAQHDFTGTMGKVLILLTLAIIVANRILVIAN